jgi:hypothetical protein
VHDICIPDSYYIPEGKHRLISPQHWSQKAKGKSSCLTLHDRAILKWNDGQAAKTVHVDSQNVFTFDLAHGYRKFTAFCTQAKYDHVSNDQAPATIQSDHQENKDSKKDATNFLPTMDELEQSVKPNEFDMIGCTTSNSVSDLKVTRASLDKQRKDPSAELLRAHYKFGHVSFSRLRAMARLGILPKTLETCPLPVCPSCLYCKAKKKPTATNVKQSINPARQVREPGDCVSVDVLVSKTPGLIAQTKGWMTTGR